jgi:hypothetical protein
MSGLKGRASILFPFLSLGPRVARFGVSNVPAASDALISSARDQNISQLGSSFFVEIKRGIRVGAKDGRRALARDWVQEGAPQNMSFPLAGYGND